MESSAYELFEWEKRDSSQNFTQIENFEEEDSFSSFDGSIDDNKENIPPNGYSGNFGTSRTNSSGSPREPLADITWMYKKRSDFDLEKLVSSAEKVQTMRKQIR